MKLNILIAFLTFFSLSFSQNVTKTFGGPQNDKGEVIIECANNDLLVGGTTTSFGLGNEDIIITRLDPFGQVLWSNAYGLTGNEDGVPLNLFEADNGDILCSFRSTSLGQINAGVIMRLNSTGGIIWQKQIGVPGGTNEYTRGIFEHDDGSIFVGMTLNFALYGSTDMLISKLDSNGDFLWSKTIGVPLNDHVSKIIPLPNGEVLICGSSEQLGPGARSSVFVKLDGLGNILNEISFGAAGIDFMTDVQYDPSFGFLVTGSTTSFGQGGTDAIVAKFDTSFNLKWYKTYGGTNADVGSTVDIINNNHYIMYMSSTLTNPNDKQMSVIGMDSLGVTLYAKSIGDEYNQEVYSSSNQAMIYSPNQDKTFLTNNYYNQTGNSNILFLSIDGSPSSFCIDTTLTEAFHTPTITPITFSISDLGTMSTSNFILTPITTLIEQNFCICPFNIPTLSDTTICFGEFLQYDLNPNLNYQWEPAAAFSCTNCPNPIFIGNSTTQVTVYVDNTVCFDTLNFTITVVPAPTINLTGPATICSTDSPVILSSNNVPGTWSGSGIVNAQNGEFNPSGLSGNVEVYFNATNTCAVEDTLAIIVEPAITANIAMNNTTLCLDGTPIQLQATPNAGAWSGFTPSVIGGNTFFDPAANGVGVFNIKFTPTGTCVIADSFKITVVNLVVNVTENLSLCKNGSGTISASPSGGTWTGVNVSQVIQGNSFNPSSLSPGNYFYVYTVNNGCLKTDTLFVEVFPSPVANLGGDVTICSDCEYEISLKNTSSSDDILWSTGATSFSIMADGEGQYSVIVVNQYGCTDYDTVFVTIECSGVLFIPNSFTPNNSAVNDEFRVSGENIRFESLVIYNRWGHIIFESYDPDGAWDGTYGDGMAKDDTYLYKVEYYECDFLERKTKMGYVTILR